MTTEITLTPSQQAAFDSIMEFLDSDSQRVFILRGYAGTGKTTITRLIVEQLRERELQFHICASTGRAAKVVSNATGEAATTVHSLLYKFNGFNQDPEKVFRSEQSGLSDYGQLYICFEMAKLPQNSPRQIYIIDESSMISDCLAPDTSIQQAQFGSGRLLTDFLNYDPNGKFLFIGDNCQLPPVGQKISPALSVDYFRSEFRIEAGEAILTDIMRQKGDSDIIYLSSEIRRLYQAAPLDKSFYPRNTWTKLPWHGYRDIQFLPNRNALISAYISRIADADYNGATLITSSNSKCNELASMVRPQLGFSGSLCVGDLLLVTQNNVCGLMNGDLVRVVEIGSQEMMARLTFVSVSVESITTGHRYSSYLIHEILIGKFANLTGEQQRELYANFFVRNSGLTPGFRSDKRVLQDLMMKDPYLNALRCVYGYALTCHKAQGGEWDDIFIDPARNITMSPIKSDYQWIYTSMTRAKKTIHLADDFFYR
ncbi:MAG: DEAD/DEAH box helicase [Bacteroidales bacterium]|nr:DEAD/DEAH box helicase [Bacteroidales bacterium]